MEPIKPVEGVAKDAEGQSTALAEVVRARYWKQLAQKMPPVEAAEELPQAEVKPEDNAVTKLTNKIRHTYAEFEINQETREVQVRIFDAESGEIVRTIPPEELAKEIARGNFQPNQLRRRAVFV